MSFLKRELQTKTSKLTCKNSDIVPHFSTLDTNFEDDCDELNAEEEELLTFTEVLDLMNIKKPVILEKKLETILTTKKITVQKNAQNKNDAETQKNKFLSYSNNKILSEICDKLSFQEVYGSVYLFIFDIF